MGWGGGGFPHLGGSVVPPPENNLCGPSNATRTICEACVRAVRAYHYATREDQQRPNLKAGTCWRQIRLVSAVPKCSGHRLPDFVTVGLTDCSSRSQRIRHVMAGQGLITTVHVLLPDGTQSLAACVSP